MLVSNFFLNVNFHYGILHPPSFLATYSRWWSQRRETPSSHSKNCLSLTILVLRICATSTQFLAGPMQAQVESELGDTVHNLSKSCQHAADEVSSSQAFGIDALINAQQRFLSATWLKTNAEFTKSWYELSTSAIHLQEFC